MFEFFHRPDSNDAPVHFRRNPGMPHLT
jgi:hypothetical protein